MTLIGSYSWGTMVVQKVKEMLGNLKDTTILEPVLSKGTPKEADLTALKALAGQIEQMHQTL